MLKLCKVTDSLFISNARSACSDELLQKEAVTLCINVSRQQPCPASARISTLRVPVYDDPNEDLHSHFDRCADVIHGEELRSGRTVVYCKNGRSRSATICIAYLMKHRSLSLTEAYEVVKSGRSVVEPNQGFWAQLERYEQELQGRRVSKYIEINQLSKLFEQLQNTKARGSANFLYSDYFTEDMRHKRSPTYHKWNHWSAP